MSKSTEESIVELLHATAKQGYGMQNLLTKDEYEIEIHNRARYILQLFDQELERREDQWFQWMINEVGYEKARAYKDISTLTKQNTKEND